MADNVSVSAGSATFTAASDELTYSGDTAKVQLVRVVHVSGAEGSKSLSEMVGTAGSPGTAVMTIQGVGSGTVVPVSDGGGALTVDGTVAVTNSGITTIAGAVSGTEMQVDVVAALPAGTNNIGDVDVLSVVPGTGATSLGKAIDNAAGATDTGVPTLVVRDDALTTLTPVDGDYVALRVNSTGALWVQNAGTSSIQVDDAAFTPGTSGVAVVGAQADEASTDSVDEGDGGALRMTLDRKLIVTTQPHTNGGLTIFRSLDLDESEEEVKATAGCVYGVNFTNTSTGTRWLKFYNATAANVTVGTTTPVLTLGLPGNTTDDVAGFLPIGGAHGVTFDTAISAAATTGVADNDTGAPAANDVIVNILYK